MNFGENLINLRKRENMSQEALAEKLDVSRQAVSKWESGASYPEMDKLILLCDLFKCTMDELVKGKIMPETENKKEAFKAHYNKFSLAIASGVSLIIFGIVVMLLLYGFMDEKSTIPVVVFMTFVLISVSIFILYGLKYSDFTAKYGRISPYTKEDYIKELSGSFNLAIVMGVGLILFGVIFLILTSNNVDSSTVDTIDQLKQTNLYPSLIIFMLLISISVFLFVYYGIQRSKYGIDSQYKDNYIVDEEKISKYSSVIMILATMIYLVLGFLFHMWHPGWIVFPLGGMLCGVVGTVFLKKDDK